MNPQNPVILCVDDEEANLKLLEKLLVPRGYTVVSAASGEVALQKLKNRKIDLVLLDILMPVMDGFEVCRLIKENQMLRNIPVILITVSTAKKNRIRGIKVGADEFLSKPFDQTEALARIKILLKVKKLNDECQRAEKMLQKDYNELERKVQERTAQLAHANEILQAEIIERKRAEERIKNSLAEKEILLKEVHHRVKNNLMTIIGLIKMQEAKADEKMFNKLLLELEGRVRAMALVHEILHKSDNLAHVDLQNYIDSLVAQIRAQFGVGRAIRFRTQTAGVDLKLDVAVAVGLILNELITNSYKFAFPEDRPRSGAGECEIVVSVKHDDGIVTLDISDNGVGLPSGVSWEKPETIGLQLIQMLSRQLNSSIELDRARGTAFHLKFAPSSAAS
jgi:two-component sensor histidine kinase/ActR/RegA family two-component response regulator